MADVSKLARARLAKTPVTGPHPDADLLTAFAERAATPAEREQVLAHLATCADCREIVALAAPEAVPLEQPVLVPRRSRWLPAGLFRWGTMVAAVAVVAVVVIVESPKYQQPSPVATQMAKAKQASDAGFASNEPNKPGTTAAATPAAEAKAAPSPTANFEYQPGASKKEASPASQMDKLAAAAPPPAPPANEVTRARQSETLAKAQPAGSVSGGLVRREPAVNMAQADMPAPKSVAQPAGMAGNVESARAAPAAKPSAHAEERQDYTADTYSGAAPAAGAGNGMAINGQRDSSLKDLHVRSIAYKWTVTSDGRVQRSSDGRTWFYVPVDDRVRLRALASDGGEVWVGGDRGALYHSTDAGESWNKVPVDRISGDIIRLVINADTIQITTSSGQTLSMSHGNASDTQAKPPSPR
jgi:hypothetical protein